MSETAPSKLYPALLAAMGDFGAVVKNKQNPHLKNYYADLGAVLEAVTEPLAKHGLLIVQRFGHDQGGPILITEIVHAESGQSIASELPIISKDPTDPQKFGGAITYARRYSLLAILSLTAEDDDGNSASQPAPRKQQRDEAPPTPMRQQTNGAQPPPQPPRATPAPPAASNPHPLLAEIRDQTRTMQDRERALTDYYMGAHTIAELDTRQEAVKGCGLGSRAVAETYSFHAKRIERPAPAPAVPHPGVNG